MGDKICPVCLQPWPKCICVYPIRKPGSAEAPCPQPHPLLSQQLPRPRCPVDPAGAPLPAPVLDDPPKEFCPDCHRPWAGCKCAGKRI